MNQLRPQRSRFGWSVLHEILEAGWIFNQVEQLNLMMFKRAMTLSKVQNEMQTAQGDARGASVGRERKSWLSAVLALAVTGLEKGCSRKTDVI